jgi:hypothetical protein
MIYPILEENVGKGIPPGKRVRQDRDRGIDVVRLETPDVETYVHSGRRGGVEWRIIGYF